MSIVLGVIVVAAGAVALAALAWQQRKPRTVSRQQAAAALANALDLDGVGNHDEFDLFVGEPIADPYIEALRREILAICIEEGRPVPGRDFGPKTEVWLRTTLERLTHS